MGHAGQPKYLQIADDLRARIKSGEFPPDSKLPTHAVLMERYEAALNTVRDALEELRKQGLAETFQGVGTFVRTPPDPGPQPSSKYAALVEQIGAVRDEVRLLRERVDDLEKTARGEDR